MTALQNTVATLSDLIAFPTVSTDSNNAIIDYIANRLTDCGARVEVFHNPDHTKSNLFATLGPDTDGGIVLSGHSDVVPAEEPDWQSDPFQMSESDGFLFGRGACDMKGFIAATLTMAPHYAALDLKRPLHFAFTYDEEVGCLGGQQLVADLKRLEKRPSVAIIGEPTDMRIIEGHKGCCEYSTEFRGLEGHGSVPERGVNAIEYAARYIGRLMNVHEELKTRAPADSRFEPPWTTLQVGRIAGGVARNVIPGNCTVDWEMRPVQTSDADHVKTTMHSYCEHTLLPDMRKVSDTAHIVTHVIGEVEGLEPVLENEALEIVRELTGSNATDVVCFGTEAGLFQSYGMSAVVCGPGSIEQAHKANEYVSLAQLDACLNMLDGLKRKLV